MATYNKYTNAIGPLLEAINAGTDSWKVALASTVNSTDSTFTEKSASFKLGTKSSSVSEALASTNPNEFLANDNTLMSVAISVMFGNL